MKNDRRRKNLQFFLSNEQRCGNGEQSLFNVKTFGQNLIFDTDLTFTTDLYRQIFGKNMISISLGRLYFLHFKMQVDLYNFNNFKAPKSNEMFWVTPSTIITSLPAHFLPVKSQNFCIDERYEINRKSDGLTSRLFYNNKSTFRKYKVILQKISVKLIWF